MIIDCLHGYFQIRETEPGQAVKFNYRYNQDLKLCGDYFTFSGLKGAPRFSIPTISYLGVPAKKVYEGEPWQVMKANGLVYDFILKTVRLIGDVTDQVQFNANNEYWTARGLIRPGSFDPVGQKITGYTCHYDYYMRLFRYTEFSYE